MKLIPFIAILFLLNGCSSSGFNFLGASKYVSNGFYVERWYLKPAYDESEIPTGTKFYGAAAQKIKHKFIIKYYVAHLDETIEEIPAEDMWDIKPSQSQRYYYFKENGRYLNGEFNSKKPVERQYRVRQKKVPIKECRSDGYCELYPIPFIGKTIYIKQSNIYQPKQQ